MKHLIFMSLIFSAIGLNSCFVNSGSSKNDTIVVIETSEGTIKVKLYNETPLHKANFLKLVNESFYDGVLFHRVIKNFMIQTGDPDSKNAAAGARLGSGGPGYTIPAEINPMFFHKKGALAAARQGDQVNPNRESSGSQFYIVQGETFTDEELNLIEENANRGMVMPLIMKFIYAQGNEAYASRFEKAQQAQNIDSLNALGAQVEALIADQINALNTFKFTPEQREVYKTIGGTPHLDGAYTVFGEVIEGLEIVDKIAATRTAAGDRPATDIKIISMKVD